MITHARTDSPQTACLQHSNANKGIKIAHINIKRFSKLIF